MPILKNIFLNKIVITTVLILLSVLAIYLVIKKDRYSTLQTLKGFYSNSDLVEAGYYKTINPIGDAEPQWFPAEKFGTANEPFIAGEGAIITDINTGKILYEKDSTTPRKIASLTKLMTAVVALEHAPLNKNIQVSEVAANVGENSMGISAGETYTLEELMYGLLLPSGNDAAYAISEGVAGSSTSFVRWMNIKAKELNLQNTVYYDPSGLDDRTTSTPEDLARLARYALKSPDFRRFVKTLNIDLTSDTHKYLYLENQTNLLRSYPGVEGVKTGYTEEAGLCLVTYARNDGRELVGVVLNSIDRKGDMVLMLDHAFSTIGVKVEHALL